MSLEDDTAAGILAVVADMVAHDGYLDFGGDTGRVYSDGTVIESARGFLSARTRHVGEFRPDGAHVTGYSVSVVDRGTISGVVAHDNGSGISYHWDTLTIPVLCIILRILTDHDINPSPPAGEEAFTARVLEQFYILSSWIPGLRTAPEEAMFGYWWPGPSSKWERDVTQPRIY
jgi:hypothetical protein